MAGTKTRRNKRSGTTEPTVRVAMSVNDANNANHVRIQLEIDCVRIATQQRTPQQAANHEVLLWRGRDPHEGVVDGVEKSQCGRRRALTIPLEGRLDLPPCHRANAQRQHLSKLSEQRRLDFGPRVAGFRRRIGLALATVELGREFSGDWCGDGRIQAIPELPNELDSLLRGERIDGKRTSGHDGKYVKGALRASHLVASRRQSVAAGRSNVRLGAPRSAGGLLPSLLEK